MYRWDIINSYIQKRNYSSYLEIGYYHGWSFDKVVCSSKQAVDPHPCKYPDWEVAESGSSFYDEGGFILKSTSDEFFSLLASEEQFDIVFIDGLHEASQVYKDIENSLKHLSKGGIIILHDCNPPTLQHTTTGVEGCWTGDTYKAVLKFQQYHPYKYFTIDTDWGVGVIQPNIISITEPEPYYQKAIDDWFYFDQYRNQLLHLIPPYDFFP